MARFPTSLSAARAAVSTLDFTILGWLTSVAMSKSSPQYLFHTWDWEMGPHVWRHSGYDEEEMAWTLNYLGNPQRGKAVLEVGANIGTSTVPFVTNYGAVHVEAFEPEPRNVKLLRCNLILNDVDRLVTVHPFAVSDQAGSIEMELSDNNAGDHRITPVDATWRASWDPVGRRRVTVQMVRLDQMPAVDQLGLVWVDTQGHEANVLEGSPDYGVPWVIEYWPYGLRRAAGLDRLNRHLQERFSRILNIRASMESRHPVFVPLDGLDELAASFGDRYTDLILFP